MYENTRFNFTISNSHQFLSLTAVLIIATYRLTHNIITHPVI